MSKFYALIPFVNFTKIQMVLTIWRILDGARCWTWRPKKDEGIDEGMENNMAKILVNFTQ